MSEELFKSLLEEVLGHINLRKSDTGEPYVIRVSELLMSRVKEALNNE